MPAAEVASIPAQEKDWRAWSDRIFNAISSGDFDASNYREALTLWIMDMDIPRAAIAHADKRLEEHYAKIGLA